MKKGMPMDMPSPKSKTPGSMPPANHGHGVVVVIGIGKPKGAGVKNAKGK